ncbi:MAG: biotin/lipoyl-binding protein, partial [Planctomycetes bacterium]|nr:biotin/lipoyl-binding protein [Planctomycetota bacterium]
MLRRHSQRLAPTFLAGLLAVACSDSEAGRAARPPLPTRDVTLVQARTLELPRAVQVNGTLEAQDELVLGFEVAGRLSELHVDFGDAVRAGELLAALDRRDFDLDVARAAATYDQARAQLGLESGGEAANVDLDTTAAVREAQAVLADAALQRDRTKELVEQNLTPPAALDAANSAFDVANSRVQRARDQVRTWIAELEVRRQELEASRKRRRDAEIRAPWSGRV